MERQVTDLKLRQAVLDALEAEPSVRAAHIAVAVEQSIVTLSGHVETLSEKTAAEETVTRVKGVRGIAQEIEVRPPGWNSLADDEIAHRITNILRWHTSVPDEGIQVSVSGGQVTLRGKVEWAYQHEAVKHAVRGMSGVTEIVDEIEVSSGLRPGDISENIERALKREAEIEAAAIRVRVAGGRVVLEGRVRSPAEREVVERAAWAVPGVHSVEDRLQVT